MGAETYGMIATAGYALALALAAAAIVMFFVLHIREVRDELTGKSARRAIEEMREGRRGTIRVAGAAAVGASGAGTAVPGEGSGSLHVREVAARGEKTGATGRRRSGRTGSTVASRPHAGTTASVGAPAPAAAASEAGTTLLAGDAPAGDTAAADAPEGGSEAGTTLLSKGAGAHEDPAAASAPGDSEAGTTLLSGDAPAGTASVADAPGDGSEAGTTLLSE